MNYRASVVQVARIDSIQRDPSLPISASSLSSKDLGAGNSADFQIECATFFAEVIQIFGVPKSVGQIYGLLYASPVPLSFSDIVERLGISKGSASQGLQFLRSLGAIKVAEGTRRVGPALAAVPPSTGAGSGKVSRSWPLALRSSRSAPDSSPLPLTPLHSTGEGDASRRIAYEPELSLRKLVSGVLQEKIAPLAAAGADRLRRLHELAEQDGSGDGFCLDRAEQLEKWRRRFRTVLPILSALLGPKGKK